MRTSVIIRYTGIALVMTAIMMAVSGVVAVVNDFDQSTMPLLFSAFITFITGAFPMIFVRAEANVTNHEGIAIVVASWIACCFFGMIPFICYGGEFTFINALFESVSGFTTTGASILDDIESLPAGLLFWRTSTAWVGGLGIVSIFSLVIPKSMDRRSVLSSAEVSDLARSQSTMRGKSLIFMILSVYISLTSCCALALKLTGMGWFDAVTNAMSTCSTCGFCVRNASIAAYDSVAVEMILVFFMAISGVSFMSLFRFVIGGKSSRHAGSMVTRIYFISLLAGTLVVTADLLLSGHCTSLPESFRQAAFQVCSITTTTGFATTDTNIWPPLSIVLLSIASIVCGCSGSTSGGLKMDRAVLLARYIRDGFKKADNPNRVIITRVNGIVVSDKIARNAMKYTLIYAAFIAAGSFVNTLAGLDIRTGISSAIACIGNVGPGFGAVGSVGNYADFPSALKFTSVLLMLAGRLEIMPLLTLPFIIKTRWKE